jgi:hypothetical protein
MSQGCWDGVFQKLMVAGGGNNTQNLSEAVSYRYLGYPVVIDQPLPTGGTVNNTPCSTSATSAWRAAWVVAGISASSSQATDTLNMIRGLAVSVTDFKSTRYLFDSPGWWESSFAHFSILLERPTPVGGQRKSPGV